ncbi:uncharacterized protein LOC131593256 [Vicia villosa]|uniref:uncharacterized protein LOC131593256 n=1 Tax=Vicia villosa TaxID=3911 RepID=UPI00273C6A5A|nr:uncharacterized protein LOC131593256 [Vicia villosa]
MSTIYRRILQRESWREFSNVGGKWWTSTARKRNKLGKIFGFVRYADIKDEKWLVDQFKNVWFGSYKAWVNISRFRRQYGRTYFRSHTNTEKLRTTRKERMNIDNQKPRNIETWKSIRKVGKSYADAIRNKEQHAECQEKMHDTHTGWRDHQNGVAFKEGSGIVITIKEEEMAWVKAGFSGFVRKAEEVNLIQQRLEKEGIMTVKVIPMGGERVFLKVEENEDFNSLVRESSIIFIRELSVIRKWEPRDVRGSRYVWMRVLGILIHAWCNKMFSLITISFGRLIKEDQETQDRERLDLARLFVRTPNMEFINKMINVQINKENFVIRLTEELCNCDPDDCILDFNDFSTGMENDDDDDSSVNSEDTCIPPSMASLEDEETMKKLEDNYEQLIKAAAAAQALNVESQAAGNRWNENNEEITFREPAPIFNTTTYKSNACSDGNYSESMGGINLPCGNT